MKIVVPHIHAGIWNASVESVADDGESWPNRGNLLLDGFTYERFGSVTSDFQDNSATCPTDFKARLGWLKLDTSNPPQAYKELASVYSKAGDTLNLRETVFHSLRSLLHRRLLTVAKDRSSMQSGVWGQWLKKTIGYGYKLWRSLYWLAPLCALGWAISYWGYYSKVIDELTVLFWVTVPPSKLHE